MIKTKSIIYVIAFMIFISYGYQNELTNNYRNLSGSYSDSVQTGVSKENSSSYKWCKSSTVYSFGYYGESGESDSNGVSNSGNICSNDSTRLSNNAQRLLGPQSYSYGNTQSYSLTSSGVTTSVNTNSINTNVVGWYYFSYDTTTIGSLTFTLTNSKSATTEVYLEKTNSNYTYQGALSSSMTVSYSSTSDKYIWVLINPTSSNSYAYFSVYANNKTSIDSSGSSSGSSSSSSTGSSSNEIVIVVAIVCSLFGVGVIIGGIVLCIICKIKANKRRQGQYNQNLNNNQRNHRSVEYNHVSHLNIVIDNQNREQGNLSLPNVFNPRLNEQNSNKMPVTTNGRYNNFLNPNGVEVGFPAISNLNPANRSQVQEGKRLHTDEENTIDGGEMPVYHAK